VVWRHGLADDVQKVVAAGVTQERELPLEGRGRRVKVTSSAEEPCEAARLGVEGQQRLRVADNRFEFATVADYA
jgi:hypothetical protein